jgi:ketosteroid isomerase-like protein
MSRENVEVVRRWLEALNRGTEEALASLPEFCEPDFDYYPVRKFLEATPCHGLDEFSQFLARYLDAWRVEWAIQDLIEIGDERVLFRGTLRTEGRGSGVEQEGRLHQCFWLRNGRIFRQEDHLTLRGALHAFGLEGESLEAVGLSEQDAHADS